MIELRVGYAMVREMSASRHTMEQHLICWFHTRVHLSPHCDVIGELANRVITGGIDKLVA